MMRGPDTERQVPAAECFRLSIAAVLENAGAKNDEEITSSSGSCVGRNSFRDTMHDILPDSEHNRVCGYS